MPIRPENKSRYPSNWKEIRESILKRADNKCEKCNLLNHSYVLRDNNSNRSCPEDSERTEWFKEGFPDHRRVKVVLTIAHLDHTPENCEPENLRAWCQKCHNTYDAPYRAKNRKLNKEKKQ